MGTAAKTDTYGYNATNLCADVLTQYNGQTFTYDEIGNPLSYRDGMSFTWENGRQLASATTSEESILYWYNADGIRTKKIRSNGEVTDYYLNGSNIITQITNSILNPDHSVRLDFYYDENSSLLGFAYDGQDYWYIYNVQNDIIGILDKDGTEVVSYTYDSWGAPISVTGKLAQTIGVINPFRYRGYYYDTEIGLYYINSRFYDPITSRCLNTDDINILYASSAGLNDKNLFTYCDNNPVRRIDVDGKLWNVIIGGAIGALAGAGSYLFQQMTQGKEFNWTEFLVSTGTGALSGGLAATGIGLIGQGALNGVISGVGETIIQVDNHLRTGAEINVKSITMQTGMGVVSGLAGGPGAGKPKIANKYGRNIAKAVKKAPKKGLTETVKVVKKNASKAIRYTKPRLNAYIEEIFIAVGKSTGMSLSQISLYVSLGLM